VVGGAVIAIFNNEAYERPVACAVFISGTRAVTVFHDGNPRRRMLRYGIAVGAPAHQQPVGAPAGQHHRYIFRVINTCKDDDLVLLEIHERSETTAALSFLSIIPTPAPPVNAWEGHELFLCSVGIPASRKSGTEPGSIPLGSHWVPVYVTGHGERQLTYQVATGEGDSAAALVDDNLQLVGIHLAGTNLVTPPPTPEKEEAESSDPVVRRLKKRITRLEVAVDKLVSQLTTAGCASYFGSEGINGFLNGEGAVSTAAGAAAVDGEAEDASLHAALLAGALLPPVAATGAAAVAGTSATLPAAHLARPPAAILGAAGVAAGDGAPAGAALPTAHGAGAPPGESMRPGT